MPREKSSQTSPKSTDIAGGAVIHKRPPRNPQGTRRWIKPLSHGGNRLPYDFLPKGGYRGTNARGIAYNRVDVPAVACGRNSHSRILGLRQCRAPAKARWYRRRQFGPVAFGMSKPPDPASRSSLAVFSRFEKRPCLLTV